jgi:hypothetical protein
LGPQVGNPVVDRSEASLLADCVPPPKQGEVELVSHQEAGVAANRGWEVVHKKKMKRKPSPPQPSTVPPPTELCSAHRVTHRPHCDRQLSPSRPIAVSGASAPASGLAGSRAGKGKSVAVSDASSHFTSRPKGLPLRKRAQLRSGDVPSRGEGLLSSPPSPP